MKSKAIAHQFEFWKYLGEAGNFFRRDGGYSTISAEDFTWPSRIFDLSNPDVELLKQTIQLKGMPHSVAVEDGGEIGKELENSGFQMITQERFHISKPNLDIWILIRRGRSLFILRSLGQRSRSYLLLMAASKVRLLQELGCSSGCICFTNICSSYILIFKFLCPPSKKRGHIGLPLSVGLSVGRSATSVSVQYLWNGFTY